MKPDADLVFAPGEDAPAVGSPAPTLPPWKILVADDDIHVHKAMAFALRDFSFDGCALELRGAFSAAEARETLGRHPDTAVLFLDVIMETRDAGVRLAQEIRARPELHTLRILLLTGQPDEVPEHDIIESCDINDYRNKIELTRQRLFTALTTMLRSCRDLRALEGLRASLEEKVSTQTRELRENNQALERTLGKLKALDEEKNFIVSLVAHDLRNPLAGIIGTLELILEEGDMGRAERDEMLRGVLTGARGMMELARKLMDAHAAEHGGIRLDPQSCDLGEIVRAVSSAHLLRAGRKRQRLEVLAEAGCHVLADRALATQVVDNLVSNAVKFSPNGGAITLRVAETALGAVRLEVRDEGPGISTADCEKLFRRYARLTARPTGGEESNGLGLSLARRLVEAMDGRIWCDGGEGRGAAFFVELPRSNGSVSALPG